MSTRVEQNERRSVAVVAVFATLWFVVLAIVAIIVGTGIIGVVVVLVIVFVGVVALRSRAMDAVLQRNGARQADAAEFAQYHNLVEGLCVTAGIPKPQLYVIDDESLNGFVVASGARQACIAVTTGLLTRLNRVELEAVLAHELWLVKSHDTAAATLLASPLVFPPQLRGWMAGLAHTPDSVETADVGAVRLTRYPPGLISALEKLEAGATYPKTVAPPTVSLWLADPMASPVVHPPFAQRIERLREL